MGDPKFSRKKYDTPSHPWEGERIANENELLRKYGLKNKQELWRTETQLRVFRQRARELQAKVRYGDVQAEKERDELMMRLDNLGVISNEASLDDILTLDVETLLGRRLQTLAYMKGLSNSAKQARQFIVHGHVSIDGKKITIPGYMVKRSEEDALNYLGHSPLADDMHPARPRDELDTGTPQATPTPESVPTEPTEGVDPSKPTVDAPAAEPVPTKPVPEPAPKPVKESSKETPAEKKPDIKAETVVSTTASSENVEGEK
ncbi:MAG: 30S ribosomal protein S4 [Thermoplasmata archaeon]|nr:30S ribosomal protein S4 [Thermoplasmata archaeon]